MSNFDGDPFLIVQGGLVQNRPNIPVIDLDFLNSWPIGAYEVREAEEVLQELKKLNSPSVQWYIEYVTLFIDKHTLLNRR